MQFDQFAKFVLIRTQWWFDGVLITIFLEDVWFF